MIERLYVGNLSFQTTEQAIRDAFAEIDAVSEVRLVADRETGRSRGFAFVTMATPDGGRRALNAMNGTVIDGRALRVNEAEERAARGGGGGAPRTTQHGW